MKNSYQIKFKVLEIYNNDIYRDIEELLLRAESFQNDISYYNTVKKLIKDKYYKINFLLLEAQLNIRQKGIKGFVVCMDKDITI